MEALLAENYLFHYTKDKLEAVRKDQMKFRTQPEKPHHNFYNIHHDPGERYPDELPGQVTAGVDSTAVGAVDAEVGGRGGASLSRQQIDPPLNQFAE